MNLSARAAAIHFDDGPNPVFPRWVGHYAVATALAMAPAVGAADLHAPGRWPGTARCPSGCATAHSRCSSS